MDEKLTYGVFWKVHEDAYTPTPRWVRFGDWHSCYEDALREYMYCKENARCAAVKIVERVELFEDMPLTFWERGNANG